MSYVDIVILVPIVFAAIRGYRKGFIAEITSLLALVLGVFGAIHLSYYLADIIVDFGWAEEDNRFLGPIAFMVTFMAIVMSLNLIGNLVTSMLNIVALGLMNRLAGILFGVAKMVLILGVVTVIIDSFGKEKPIIPEKMMEDSLLLEPLRSVATNVVPAIKDLILWDQIPKSLEELEDAIDDSQRPKELRPLKRNKD